ncbi:MAG: hypothetical protein RLN60_04205 [Phycisphaerales bacterium]
MRKQRRAYTPKHAVEGRLRGGFRPVAARSLLGAWKLYAEGVVEFRDLRLWLASQALAHETEFRGFALDPRRQGERLKHMTGDRRAAERVTRRAERVGSMVEEVGEVESAYFRNLRRRVPLPRRLAVHLAKHGSRATVAAAVGHLLRCLYWRGSTCVSGGTAKATRLADELGVSIRSIRRGRRELIDAGWLESVDVPQLVLNGHGAVVRVRSPRSARERVLSPREHPSNRRLTPPMNRDQLRCLLETKTGPESRSSVESQRVHLRNRGFGEDQFERLAKRGVVPRSEAMRLAVLSCAQYAARVGTQNPMGPFWFLVSGGRWDRPSQQDEDAARRPKARHAGSLAAVGNALRSSGVLLRAMQHRRARAAQ